MPINIGELLLSALTGPLETIGRVQLSQLLMKVTPIETRKTILVSLYPIIDVELEKITSQTKTKIDDALVRAFKGAIEDAAQETGVALPNLDND